MANVKRLLIEDENIFDILYPVGSIYLTFDKNFNPNNSFTGEWESIIDDNQRRFLLVVNDTAFTKGGEETHKLTLGEMPNHSHQQYVTANSGGTAIRMDYDSDMSGGQKYDQGVTTGGAGNSEAHNNMPPYVTCFGWKRVS